MKTVFFLTKLKRGVKPAQYEKWIREYDYPVSRRLKTILDYKVHRIIGSLSKQKSPYDYLEVIQVSEIEKYKKTLGTAEMKELLQQWRKFIASYVAVHGEALE